VSTPLYHLACPSIPSHARLCCARDAVKPCATLQKSGGRPLGRTCHFDQSEIHSFKLLCIVFVLTDHDDQSTVLNPPHCQVTFETPVGDRGALVLDDVYLWTEDNNAVASILDGDNEVSESNGALICSTCQVTQSTSQYALGLRRLRWPRLRRHNTGAAATLTTRRNRLVKRRWDTATRTSRRMT